MKKQEIAPKTLVAVLAAQIREESETLAKRIVDNAKGNDVDYSMLIEKYVLGKDQSNKVLFKSFAEQAFAEIVEINKDVNKILNFEIKTKYEWGKYKGDSEFRPSGDNPILFKCEIDEKHKDYNWNKSVSVSGDNIHTAFDSFKLELKKLINHPDVMPTEVIIDTPEPQP